MTQLFRQCAEMFVTWTIIANTLGMMFTEFYLLLA